MLPFRSGRPRRAFLFFLMSASLVIAPAGPAQQGKKRGKKKAETTASPTATAGSTGQVPLPIGHEAKGLVLPDFDENGHLRGRFTAGTARRVDAEHMEFHDLNITTFTDDNKIDLQIAMADSVLDLNTHVLTSPQRTTVKRYDFEIVGDRARFEPAAHHSTLTGNVKMVITDAAKLTEQKPEQTPK
jgi:hypothetical protein